MAILDDIREAIIRGDRKGCVAAVEQALSTGLDAGLILNTAMIPAMSEVGARFERGDYFVPEMLVAARSMQTGVNLLRPLLVTGSVQPLATVVLGTIRGDLHDIGKNLVGMMLEGAGFAVKDLGVNVEPERFVQAVQEGAQIVGMSALLTTTMPAMKTTIDAIQTAGLRQKVKIMVGGAPLTQAYAEQIGADGYSPDANSAVRLAKQLLGLPEP